MFVCLLFFSFCFWPTVCFNMLVSSFHFIALVGCGGRKNIGVVKGGKDYKNILHEK